MTDLQIGENNKPLKGLQDKGLVSFECVSCNKSLLVLQLTSIKNDNQTEISTLIAVKCCECGSFSEIQQITGQFHPGTPNDHMAFDVLDNDTNAPDVDILFKAWDK